ncbi:sodium:solute symporter family protein [Nocardioidaceae bacterium SCSIO 66511]|nr:sodium:solute symporter family protein [Nocardioidaceae bacterium SCSIO 66511]
MDATYIWTGIVIYIVFASVTAWLSRSRDGSESSMTGYFLGNRGMGGFLSAMSYSATTYSAFMLIGLAGLTYSGGVGALGFELIYLCGVTLVLIFGPRFWLAGKEFGYVTPSEMLGHRYQNRAVAVVTALTSCIFLIPYSAVQLAGVGYLLNGMSDGAISFTAGTVLATVLAIAFALVAGLRSVVWTDSLQAIIMIISATIVVIVVINHLGGIGGFFDGITEASPGALTVPGNGFFSLSTFIGLTLPWIFFSISNPQVSQRLYTPKSMKDLRVMLIGFMIFGFIYTLVAVTWGFAALIENPGLETGDLATPTLLASDIVPTALGVIVMVGIMAAAVSTIDSILLTLSSMVTRDVFAQAKPTASDSQQLAVGKIVIPVIAVLAYLFARLELDLIAVLSVSASAGLLVMVPPIIGTFFWRRGTAAGVLAGVICGGIVVAVLEYTKSEVITGGPLNEMGKLFGQDSGVWGLIVSVVLFVGVSLVTKAPTERADHFLSFVSTKLKERQAV